MLQPFKLEKEGKGTDYWVRKLTRQSMPVAGSVIAELNKLSDSDDSDLNHLAELILRDPNLTSHVLRIANSVQYSGSGSRVNTVSRAIVIIGLKGMRAICISLMLIDSLMKQGSKERMLELVAQGFHAATQARALVSQQGQDAAEEVFIAALLYNLGEMAYWASTEVSSNNDALITLERKARGEAEQAVLGTTFNKITRGLARQWKLGSTLEEALTPGAKLSKSAQAVLLGEQISRSALKGWDSPGMKKLVHEVSRYTYLEPDECLSRCQEQAEAALDVARQFGASDVCHMIPSRHQTFKRTDTPAAKTSRILKSDPQLQLNILRELASVAAQKQNVNTVFQMVIEGIHRGIGMERVAVGFIKEYRITAKYSLGYGAEDWRTTFNFDAGPYADNIFVEAIDKGGFLWINSDYFKRNKSVNHKETTKVLGGVDCLIYVLEVNGKKPGLIYADRADFGGLITQNHADSFLHFASQAQYCLQAMSSQHKR
ncbi:MAG TPA: HDOD domain-containing protein [Marinagarivorans sp.]